MADGVKVTGNVYGGGNLAEVGGSVTVNIKAGTVEKDVYGGGALANTNINNVTAGYGTDNETITYTHTTTVNLMGGTINGDAYGGGLGRLGEDPVAAKVYGNITVNLGGNADGATANATAFMITNYDDDTDTHDIDESTIVKSGRVFGCNNLNGSPLGSVTVNVYKTVKGNVNRTAEDPKDSGIANKTNSVPHTYQLAAVYGGGNLANYTTAGKKTSVNIKTCNVSVESVYGGGNAAAVPETDVTVSGAYEIQYVFGGGNGKDPYTLDNGTSWTPNAGANVNGNTKVLLVGGYIHEAYGGSNEKGTVRGKTNLNTGTGGACDLDVVKLVGAGKNADIDGDAILVLGCMPEAKVDEIYGGADNANVNGNVELTITSGNFGKVFGGNNRGGLIKGHIKLNIEETSCRAINIDELYLGGNEAAYSIYGYYDTGTTDSETGKKVYKPRASETDHTETAVPNPDEDDTHTYPYANPVLNVISCTHIGRVFGGGYGEGAALYGSPTVNLNMIPGVYSANISRTGIEAAHRLGEIGGTYTNANNEEVDGGVFGGGDGAAVYGNTTVNIGTATTVQMTSVKDEYGELLSTQPTRNVEGAYINCNVYGGGNLADVTGNTQVNICAVNSDDPATTDVVEFSSIAFSGTGYEGVTIKGNVFGGGKGVADNFFCNKAMVGVNNDGIDHPDGGTNIIIGNGTVEGTVYGGGEIGRVEKNTVVTIGLQEETSSETTSAPVIKGNVFGAGKGLETHGYAALVRGNPTVTVQGHAKVEKNVYGGGEIASVARYDVSSGSPVALAVTSSGSYSGKCTVIVRDNAEVGTEDDGGNVFGAGKGILPVAYDDKIEGVYDTSYDHNAEQIDNHKPKRMILAADKNTTDNRYVYTCYDTDCINVWEYFPTVEKYIEFIQTQALSSQTDVTVSGNATVRGSVYGGSENGIVQYDAHVNVTGGEIGVGQKGGVTFGNVFGAGRGYVDASLPENLLAGIVRGNTEVTITDGKILHNVYGGGAYGSVGIITTDDVTYVPGETSVSNMPVSWANNTGTATIRITGGTIGVDGHEDGMVFGSSRGDVGAPGSILDHQAWVYETHVIIGDSENPGSTTTPLIRGSIYGSGENGHVFTNTKVDIHGGTIGLLEAQTTDEEGYKGADYLYRGNVYGGGCGTDKYYKSGVAPQGHTLTDGMGDTYNALSGCVLGNTEITIDGGHVVHNVYGAGAMGSVGKQGDDTSGKTKITISGGRIGDDGVNDGNVYGAARGGQGISNDLAHVRESEVNIKYTTTPTGDNSDKTEKLIAGSVFGGGEAGTVKEKVVVNMEGGMVLHDVYGGGALADTQTSNWDATNSTWADATAKSSLHTTQVNLKGGTVKGDMYGGGLGRLADTQAEPAVTAVEAKVYGDVTVTTTGGKATRVFGCNNLNGAPQGTVAVNINGTDDITGTTYDYAIGNVYGGGNQAVYSYADEAHPLTVTMAGGNVNNIFGGGLSADVVGSIAVKVTGGEVINDVYGGGEKANTNTANWNTSGSAIEYVEVAGITTPTFEVKSVDVGASVTGLYTYTNNEYTLITDPYAKATTGTTYYELQSGSSVAGYYTLDGTNYIPTTSNMAENGKTYYRKQVVGTWKEGMNPGTTTGSGESAVTTYNTVHKTTVDLTGGFVGNVYGGGLGDNSHAANVYGDVSVTVNDPSKMTQVSQGVVFTNRLESFTIGNTGHSVGVTGRVFGCNNINGTPTGNVTVHVYSTRNYKDGEYQNYHVPTETETEAYEIQGVYGGGNQADYLPADGKKTSVIIEGCYDTSIKKVYGGGNSAPVPATDVLIKSAYAIGYAFGGGNGGEYIKKNGEWQENEGAIVIGTATIACKGGKVGSVFGGSDAKGTCGGVNIDTKAYTAEGSCPLVITRLYGAGNEADIVGNVNMILASCTNNEIEYVHGGSYNANVTGSVTLNITSGIFRNVYGGNDARGSIGGNITVNIEETEESCHKPIIIQNLVGGGNNAPYPGINRAGEDLSQNPGWHGNITVNVKSATRIDNVYGGCFNAEANADCVVNVNMREGIMAGETVSIPVLYQDIPNISEKTAPSGGFISCKIDKAIGTIGNVFGGGNEGKVKGNTTVNIGTAETVKIMKRNVDGQILDKNDQVIVFKSGEMLQQGIEIGYVDKSVEGAHITGNVYGGGKLADVTGNASVNICTANGTTSVANTVASGVSIAGNVYGGGKGADDTFTCEKAMIGTDGAGVDANFNDKPDYTDGNTRVIIANGKVGTLEGTSQTLKAGTGNVYGGGEIGRVEKNTSVIIGLGDGVAPGSTPSSAPIIYGDVFGAGKGVETHGYSALVRGNPSVTVQGNAKVGGSVYGGGEIASVARYQVVNGSPVALANNTSGFCNVTVKGYAEIGPDNMQMTKSGGPDFSGNVFGAGKGVLPKVYTYVGDDRPHRMLAAAQIATISSYSTYSYSGEKHDNIWEAFGRDNDYHAFIETLALSSQTDVTISDHAFVKGSVYGGSENGIVQYDTHVMIEGDCQIGCGEGQTAPYSDWNASSLAECSHWDFTSPYTPYDKYNYGGGSSTGTDGHTYYGNVFGGGSGKDPYASGKWHREAGIVRGNTVVEITGGHILTSVYGGNEHTDVVGSATVRMTGGTLGVPRSDEDITNHPVTCYLFGAGKGDQRTDFNTWTNVANTTVEVSGTARIFGSVLGGGEDGHVLGNTLVNIGGTVKIDLNGDGDTNDDGETFTAQNSLQIGTTGTSGYDGNVFGGGRGLSGEALTAGSTGGNVTMNISGGTMLGSVYGGGRMASVGIFFTDPDDAYYGQLKDDDVELYTAEDEEVIAGTKQVGDVKTVTKSYGHITMNITGGTIGSTTATEHTVSGNVYGGCMGRITLLNGNKNLLWPKLAVAKITAISISGTANIKNNVYGGGEIGIVRNEATVNVSGGTVHGSVFGGGYGSADYTTKTTITPAGYPNSRYTFTPLLWAGCVSGNTNVNVSGGTVEKNVYGGGELASVGLIDFVSDNDGNFTNMPKHTNLTNSFGLSWPYEFHYHAADPKDPSKDGKATVKITGSSIIGTNNDDDTGYVFGGSKGQVAFNTTDEIDEQRYTEAFCANVRETEVIIGTTSGEDQPTIRTVYGGGEDGHVYENATVIINDGSIAHSVFGGGKGETTFITKLWDRDHEGQEKNYSGTSNPNGEPVHSWTAGRVYGNTSITMNGGSVGWFIYGGGNMASVGKGNYAGGSDDYSTAGYGELPANGALWTNNDFLNSGKSTVNLFGGTVGATNAGADSDGIPYGSVFGGSRGKAAMNVDQLSPRYKYLPDFFLGYVNNTFINFGGTTETGAVSTDGPTIYGSLYGGGQDGHVRNGTEVRIFKGTVAGQTADARSGNVFGAGSGIGTYLENNTKKCSSASGSVTCKTLVEMNGGTIARSVYGGGAMASVGPPRIGQDFDEQKAASSTTKSYSYSLVNIKGGTIKGDVFGASRGPSDEFRKQQFVIENIDTYDPMLFSTDLWSDVIISGGTIGDPETSTGGNVYGGGETGYVKCGVTVNILGGEIKKDVYGGGARANTNTSNLKQDETSKLWSWTDSSSKTAKYTTTVNLLGGTIGGDAYGGGLGRKQYLTPSETGYEFPVEALVYGDVKVNLNGLESNNYVESVHGVIADKFETLSAGSQIKSTEKGAMVTRIFGCNNLNGSPQGKVRVHVFGTQNADSEHNTINKKYDLHLDATSTSNYDVAAVYGGANLAAYTPMGPAAPGTGTTITTDNKNTTQRTEVIIDGCSRTSIYQVYGGGNAASAPATYVEVNGTYEIGEVFGGGNGADNYSLVEGNNIVWYKNPGANVGYVNYSTHPKGAGQGAGTEDSPYIAVEDESYDTPEERKAAAAEICYGSGVATTAIKGGKIHVVYGGSNEKGNISNTAMSMYESMNEDCPMSIDQTYGGSKNAIIDAEIETQSQCAHGVEEIFGGSMNADVNNDVVLTITNGSSFKRVFGGNNTSGAINGSITVNIEEGGCEPIKIGELYAGGYLAPYSIYGYEMESDGTSYKTELVPYVDTDGTTKTLAQRIPLTSGGNPKNDPRINVISATQIGTIYGGGYQAKVVGNPHVNVNMTNGKVEVGNTATTGNPVYQDEDGNTYSTVSEESTYYATVNNVKTEVQKVEWTSVIDSQLPTENKNDYIDNNGGKYVYKNGNTFYKVSTVTAGTKYWATLDIGTVGNIYGGGNMADIVGDTYVEIGTGKWLTWDASGNPVWETTDANGNQYTSTQTANAVNYTQTECNEHNAALRGYIPSGVTLTADQATAVNTALGTSYNEGVTIYTEDAAAYNAKLTGFWTTSTVKAAATETTPAEYYTQAECNVHNAALTGYIACTTTLTAKQAIAVNEAISSNYAAGATIYTEDAAAYIATLNGHISTNDVKTPAVWTWKNASNETVDQPTSVRNAATITGNVYGGGKGVADNFFCDKAMVGVNNDGINHPDGGTNVTIANGTVGTIEDGKLKAGTGNVYGGGQIGRVEKNTMVTIGVNETDAPIIYGDVFGAGKGVETHGYSALVRGNPTVIVQGKAQVRGSVYGGGEIASVARYKVVNGSPVALANKTSGNCKVIIRDDAVIGPDNMQMYHKDGSGNIVANDKPDDTGHVFGAGKGVLPGVYSYADNAHKPRRMLAKGTALSSASSTSEEYDANNIWEYFGNDADYHKYIETLALSSKTDVIIGGNAFVKGSVYGGSLSGIVQYNTYVTIEGDCQIGCGKNAAERYADEVWEDNYVLPNNTDLECASWDYVKTKGEPYDPFATNDGHYVYTDWSIPDALKRESSDEGKPIATDGHTYYGNVFGGGSGVVPYAPGLWHRTAGVVRGNTVVDITGGHILTSVYGGNEHTDVGIYSKDNDGEPTVPVSGGKCTVNFGGTATLGVPRTLEQIAAHPVTCYLFGAGKGDQRIFFNTWTNIREAEVNVTGGRIYGSVFGGGEDGHVIEDVTVNISDAAKIGTTGTSYVDGNVFGAGRGFSGEALTAGSVGGNVTVNVSGGTMLGSIYGGGRLASVGIGFNASTNANYGSFTEDETTGDNPKAYGYVTVNISGGTIGNDTELLSLESSKHTKGGNVFGGSMGRLELLDGTTPNSVWPQLGQVKSATVNISGTAVIKSNVYGGGELGTVRDKTYVNISGGTVKRDVYGGGYGSDIIADNYKTIVEAKDDDNNTIFFGYTPMQWAGCVGQEAHVNISGGRVLKSVYGGGEMASVGVINYMVKTDATPATANEVEFSHTTGASPTYTKFLNIVKHANESNSFALSWPYEFSYIPGYEGKTNVTITGGRIGLTKNEDDNNPFEDKDNGDVYGGGKGIAGNYKEYLFCANVGSTDVTINYPSTNTATSENYMSNPIDCVAGALYGGAENGHVMGDTKVTLTNGLIGHSLYGGGSGKGQFKTWLTEIPATRRQLVSGNDGNNGPHTRTNDKGETEYEATCYSITAGKVFGNTEIEMTGGSVLRNIYGGGNMGSVGKGNYAGGADDYSTAGYGETLTGNLWTSAFDSESSESDSNKKDNAWHFLNSGKCKVTVTGGTVGYVNESDPNKSMYPLDANKQPYSASLPYGNIFGGCRGESAPNITESPRYLYCPEFFVGYANETEITVGSSGQDNENAGEPGKAPRIWGSVYGGGQDGHIRRDASVTINSGEIGLAYNKDNRQMVGTLTKDNPTQEQINSTGDLDNLQWFARGNVYGAGSGMGKYKYDINHDGDYLDEVDYKMSETRTVRTKEEDNSTSAGSVTRFTTVNINGGIIHRNVYGGGSLSTVGAPMIGQDYLPYRKGDTTEGHGIGKQSSCEVIISGTIGTPADYQSHYGGEVYGASRGLSAESPLGSVVWTKVHVKNGANIQGNVFGGGDAGMVKRDSEVIIGEAKTE